MGNKCVTVLFVCAVAAGMLGSSERSEGRHVTASSEKQAVCGATCGTKATVRSLICYNDGGGVDCSGCGCKLDFAVTSVIPWGLYGVVTEDCGSPICTSRLTESRWIPAVTHIRSGRENPMFCLTEWLVGGARGKPCEFRTCARSRFSDQSDEFLCQGRVTRLRL